MKGIIFMIIMVLGLSGISLANDIIRFSGETGYGTQDDNQLNGTVESCGNGICQESFGEDYLNCPSDCEEEIEPYLNLTLISSDVSAISDNSYGNGFAFTFKLDYYEPSAKYFEIYLDDWDSNGNKILTEGNTIMEYTNSSGSAKVYNVKNHFQEPASNFIDPIMNPSLITIKVKIPTTTVPGTNYVTHYTGGIFS